MSKLQQILEALHLVTSNFEYKVRMKNLGKTNTPNKNSHCYLRGDFKYVDGAMQYALYLLYKYSTIRQKIHLI